MGFNPWVAFVVALAIFTAGGLADHFTVAAAQLAAARLETADLQGKVEKNRADANQNTINGIQAAIADVLAADAQRQRDAQARQQRLMKFLEALSHVPDSKKCVDSPAMRVLIDSVRAEGTGANH